MAKASDPTFISAERKRYVPVGKLKPLIYFLMDRYDSLGNVALVTKIPYGTLNSLMYDARRKSVRPEVAEKLVAFVLAHRRSEAGLLDGSFENDVPVRFALPEERKYRIGD